MRIGLKLWSLNTDFYYEEAIRLYEKGVFDYVELYVVPNTVDMLKKWKQMKIPFSLHAPHFMHGVNLADRENFDVNKKRYDEVDVFFNELEADYIVVHSGTMGTIDETIRQLNIIKPKKFIIENKPYHSVMDSKLFCRGSTIHEIQRVLNETEAGFCLDIGHAICSSNYQKLNPYEYIREFNKLSPTSYHLSDNYIDSTQDRHLHFGAGDFDFEKIVSVMDKDRNLAIETQKSSKENLNDFEEDANFIKGLLNK